MVHPRVICPGEGGIVYHYIQGQIEVFSPVLASELQYFRNSQKQGSIECGLIHGLHHRLPKYLDDLKIILGSLSLSSMPQFREFVRSAPAPVLLSPFVYPTHDYCHHLTTVTFYYLSLAFNTKRTWRGACTIIEESPSELTQLVLERVPCRWSCRWGYQACLCLTLWRTCYS